MRLKDIIEFLEENVDGKTLFTKELIYKLGIYIIISLTFPIL